MFRAAGVLTLLLAACGRVGFSERLDIDATAPDAAIDASGPRFSRLEAYGQQTCALYEGRPYCWGSNTNGMLGDGTTTDREIPTAVSVPISNVEAISTGNAHTCAIIAGELWCWGMGFGVSPGKVTLPAPASAVDIGDQATCVIADVTHCWGVNSLGQLGDGSMTNRPAPTPILGPAMSAIHVGDDHACGLPTSGAAPMCWGHNDDGALGTGSFTPTSSATPLSVTGGITTLPLIAGWHACALQNGEVWCWGRGLDGELGTGGSTNSAAPLKVPSLANVSVLATGGGPADRDASCVIVDGNVSCWGMGLNGRLGNGLTDPQPTPVPVAGLPAPAIDIALGYGHTCALLVDGDIWCWGRGAEGQLGHGMFTGSFTPVRVTRPI